MKLNCAKSCWLLFGESLVNLLDRFPLVIAVGNDEEEDVPGSFILVKIVPNSVEFDLLVMGEERNGDKVWFSWIGVLVLALAVWWCKFDKDEGVSRLTKYWKIERIN